MPGLAPLAFQMFFTSVVSTATLAPPFWLECSTASSAASFWSCRGCPLPAHDHAVAAGGFLHVEPQIFTARGVQGQLIVLQIVPADQNLKAVA